MCLPCMYKLDLAMDASCRKEYMMCAYRIYTVLKLQFKHILVLFMHVHPLPCSACVYYMLFKYSILVHMDFEHHAINDALMKINNIISTYVFKFGYTILAKLRTDIDMPTNL